ncbi:unnamed protein product [Allacma fusca]|uniref:WAP domain-containing protein n=1 Tax=Allacma fusca TaxID=39272 RepID=A0A8J2KCS7_9HEXA|nr:unnamed protein product [Allacma fusca]
MKVFAVFLLLAVALCLFHDSNAQRQRRPRPVLPRGTDGNCPDVSGIGGICSFDPRVNCLEDSQCGGNQKCCPFGCGRQCLIVRT